MQFNTKFKYYTALSLATILCSSHLGAQEIDEFERNGLTVSSHLWSYSSYSQQKMGYPLRAGYPAIQAKGVAVRVNYKFSKGLVAHELSLLTTAPAGLTSNNGTGQNLLIENKSLSYHKSILGYKLWLNLIDLENIRATHSFSSGVLLEFRRLNYLSGDIEKTRDINLYLGPCFHIAYDVSQQWQVFAGFDAHFYLPYLNYGWLKTFSETGEQRFSSPYRAFYYQTNFSLGIRYDINKQMGVKVAFSKDDLVGFANRKPSFKVNDIIHHKLDRVYALKVGVEF